MIYFLLVIFCCSTFSVPPILEITGPELLEKSIKYHDKKDKWGKAMLRLKLSEQAPDGYSIDCVVDLNSKTSGFRHSQLIGDDLILRQVNQGKCNFAVNNATQINNDDIETFRLNCTRTKYYRNYYSFLWGLPMKLKDVGTIIDDEVEVVHFNNEFCFQLKVTYAKDVGNDIWYFYMDQQNFALRGYRYYTNEAEDDGEYVVLDGEQLIGNMLIPKNRKWYSNFTNKYIGVDILKEGDKIKDWELRPQS